MPTEVTLPKALQDQQERLKNESAGKPVAAVEQPPAEMVMQPQASPAPAPEPKADDEPVKAEAMSPAAVQLANTGIPARQEEAKDEDWKHKYDVVNGKYRKETSDLRDENKRLKEQLEQAQREKSQEAQTESVSLEDISDDDIEAMVSPELIDEFGHDYWRQQILIQRNVLAASAKNSTEHDSRVDEIENRFKQQERERFYSELDRLFPEWERINGTANWNEFLGKVDPLTRVSYNGLLTDAYEEHDAQRVAEIFRLYSTGKPRGSGFDELVTPSPHAPSEGTQARDTMPFDEWNAQMNKLPSLGLSPTEYAVRQQKLADMMRNGKVTGVPGSG